MGALLFTIVRLKTRDNLLSCDKLTPSCFHQNTTINYYRIIIVELFPSKSDDNYYRHFYDNFIIIVWWVPSFKDINRGMFLKCTMTLFQEFIPYGKKLFIYLSDLHLIP